jgi:hypothetical protein
LTEFKASVCKFGSLGQPRIVDVRVLGMIAAFELPEGGYAALVDRVLIRPKGTAPRPLLTPV